MALDMKFRAWILAYRESAAHRIKTRARSSRNMVLYLAKVERVAGKSWASPFGQSSNRSSKLNITKLIARGGGVRPR